MAEQAPAAVSSLPEDVTDTDYKPPEGRLGNLTAPQQHALDRLKKDLTDEGAFVQERMDDMMLLRFLRARKWDVGAAKKMLLDAEKWRREIDIENIVHNFDFVERAEVTKYYPQYYHKQDKDGRPLCIERLGLMNVVELHKVTTQERQLKFFIQEYEKFVKERLPACSKAVGHPVETTCTILDLKNVGLRAFWDVKSYVQEASGIGQNYYPETMGKFFIINAPWMFSTVWSVIKAWLDPVTVAKIIIPSGDGRQELLAQIPAENLPVEFGGLCTCPGGCAMSDAGPWSSNTSC